MALTFDKDEVVVYEVRRHWFVIYLRIVVLLVFMLIPLLFYSIIKVLPIKLTAEGNVYFLLLFFYALWLLFVWIIGVILWTDYFLDVMLITNKRLIRVEQNGLFNREVSYLDLQNIQDVKSQMNGFLATMLNFGHLSVQTAAQNREFVMKCIASPFATRDRLNQAIALYNKENPQTYVFAGSLEEDKQNKTPSIKILENEEQLASDVEKYDPGIL